MPTFAPQKVNIMHINSPIHKMPTVLHTMRICMAAALPTTWKSASWLLKLMIPISLAVTLLQFFGILEWMALYLHPVFVHLCCGLHLGSLGRHLCGHCRHDVYASHHEAGHHTIAHDSPLSCLAHGVCRQPQDGFFILEDVPYTHSNGFCMCFGAQYPVAIHARPLSLYGCRRG